MDLAPKPSPLPSPDGGRGEWRRLVGFALRPLIRFRDFHGFRSSHGFAEPSSARLLLRRQEPVTLRISLFNASIVFKTLALLAFCCSVSVTAAAPAWKTSWDSF